MANSKSTSDILKGALNHAGELTNGLSDFHQLALKYTNKLYKDILSGASVLDVEIGEPFNFARAREPMTLVLQPAYESGTVSMLQNSINGVFSVPPPISLKDRYLKIDNNPTYYKILTHAPAAAAFTIDTPYIEETVPDASFKALAMIYNLGDGILRLLEPWRVYDVADGSYWIGDSRGKIFVMETKRFREEYPLQYALEGIPDKYTIIYRDDIEFLVEFNRSPGKQVKIDCDYIPFPDDLIDSDESIPVIPREYIDILEFGTAFYLLQDKHDDKADRFFNLARTALHKMLQGERRQVTHGSENKGRLIPRQDQRNTRARFFFTK